MDNILLLLSIGLLILLPFLIATLLIHIRVSELNKFHRKYIICYLITLIVAFLSSIWENFYGYQNTSYILVGSMFSSSMSTFLWLNVICFDLYLQVRNVKQFRRLTERTRVIGYSLYAWGLSILLFSIILFLAFSGFFIGRIDTDNEARAYVFSVPITIIFGVNGIMYMNATFDKQAEAEEINEGILNEEKTAEELIQQNEIFKFHLYFFIVLGFAWTIDSVVTIFIYRSDYEDPFFLPVDISNFCQGIVIFVWTISRPIIRDSIKERWNAIFGNRLSKVTVRNQPNIASDTF